jgi:H+-transporting ATPase
MSQHSFASSKDQEAMDPSPLLEGEHRVDMERPSLNTFERGSLMRASFRNSSMTSRGTAASLASVGTGAGGVASAADKAEQDLEKELTGLDDAQVAAARTEWGRNEIPEKIIPLWYMIAKQLQGPMPHMIQASTVLSAALQQWAPFAILLTIIVINTAIGFHEEKKAKDALDGLKSSMTSTVPCKRNGQVVTLDVTELVPQDVIFLRGGNIVPADCRWLEGDVFQVDTAALTGEALPRKVPSEQYGTEMLSGSVIKIGEGFCVCDKTGVHTEIGMGMAAIQENSGVEMGFFEKKIMAVVTGIIAITVVDIIVLTLYQCIERGHLLYGGEQPMLLWDLAIMVAAVPIALPLVIQVCGWLVMMVMMIREGAVALVLLFLFTLFLNTHAHGMVSFSIILRVYFI